MEKKHFLKSKTFWINSLAIIGALAAGISDMLTAGQAVTIMALVNLVLRTVTSSGVRFTSSKE